MKRWKWAVLIFELALFALILVLPQVDLPEFTFHGGNAPVAAKARLSSAPVAMELAIRIVQTRVFPQFVESRVDINDLPVTNGPHYRLSLLCTLVI